MIKKVIVLVGFFASSFSHGSTSIEDYFSTLNDTYKGALGQNMMQGWNRRQTYRNWAKNGGSFYFQAAFRNDVANNLLDEHGVYTGNLFSTNYYELRAEFILGDRMADNLSKSQGLEKLIEVSNENPLVYDRATQMLQNWNLERLYVLKNPSTKIAIGFQTRGVAGAEYEREYARDFINYYVDASENNKDLLALIKLADSSALFSSSNFEKIRGMATSLYENYPSREIKRIRDSIHNQLTPDIVVAIDEYLKKNNTGRAALLKIKDRIQSYFARGVVDINHIAKQANIPVQNLEAINNNAPELSALQAYAQELVESRDAVLSDAVPVQEKYVYMGYTSVASSFLFEKTKLYVEQNRLNSSNLNELNGVILKLLYLRGYYNSDILEKYSNVPTDFDGFEEFFDELLTLLIGNIKSAYGPYIEKWQEVDPHLSGIVDDTLRSSALSVYDQILNKMD